MNDGGTLVCPGCGAPALPERANCPYCGIALALVSCPQCLARIFRGAANFCSASRRGPHPGAGFGNSARGRTGGCSSLEPVACWGAFLCLMLTGAPEAWAGR